MESERQKEKEEETPENLKEEHEVLFESGEATPLGGKEHYVGLFKRYVAEVTVLGCLAFTVWCNTQNDGWDDMAKHVEESSGLHENGEELLELVEDVHMQIFIAMLLVFIGMDFLCAPHTSSSRRTWKNTSTTRDTLPALRISLSKILQSFLFGHGFSFSS